MVSDIWGILVLRKIEGEFGGKYASCFGLFFRVWENFYS